MRMQYFPFLAGLLLMACGNPDGQRTAEISVSFSSGASDSALDGRLLLMLSSDPSGEPRFQIGTGLNTQLIFGMNVDGMAPGETRSFTGEEPGFPYADLTLSLIHI